MMRTQTHARTRSMFQRLWLRSLAVKRPQALVAFGSLAIGAAIASLLLNLASGVRRKMTDEFRAYGPNVVVAPAAAQQPPAGGDATGSAVAASLGSDVLDEDVWRRVAELRSRVPGLLAIPMLDVVARAGAKGSAQSANVVAVGTELSELPRLNPTWQFAGGVHPGTEECILGARVAAQLGLSTGGTLVLEPLETTAQYAKSENRNPKPEEGVPPRSRPSSVELHVSALVTTGGPEDSQTFVPLEVAEQLADLPGKLSLVELTVPGDAQDVGRAVRELRLALASEPERVEVRAVPQVLASEGKVLETLRALLVSLTALILVTVALCVMATVTVLVLERRKDVALMKAIGASNRLVMGLFLAETSGLGLAGGLAGFAFGAILARELGQRLFQVTIGPAWWSAPAICAASVIVAILSTLGPVGSVRDVEPAMTLKGE